jgi:uncharacterized LabA/DUF88 family protein
MVLNIFPRKKEPEVASSPTTTTTLPEPSPEALDGDGAETKRPARRGSRGGQGRKRSSTSANESNNETAEVVEAVQANQADEESQPEQPAPRRRSSRSKAAAPEAPADAEAAATAPSDDQSPDAHAEAKKERPARGRRAPAAKTEQRATTDLADGASLLHAIEQQSRQIEQQSRQIEHLAHAQEELARRIGSNHNVSAPPARVGIFVDAANIELACERMRPSFRLNWKKVFDMLTRDRHVVRAIAYCPVHDDPGVSIETQRFVEPFLDKGFKIFTKPLKRFQDNTIKANVDIELAIDIIEMLDRLDVVCLASGDGDFQRLVELIQSRGVRVEVIGVGHSVATNLRNAADEYIDLHTRLREVRA